MRKLPALIWIASLVAAIAAWVAITALAFLPWRDLSYSLNLDPFHQESDALRALQHWPPRWILWTIPIDLFALNALLRRRLDWLIVINLLTALLLLTWSWFLVWGDSTVGSGPVH